MRSAVLALRLKSDIVLSARSATLGGHETLTYIPGAALLGWSASRLYTKLRADAYTVFHSGQVRFGNGLPLTPTGYVAYPVPENLCERKATRDGLEWSDEGGTRLQKIAPHSIRVRPDRCFEEAGFQTEALKNIYVAPNGHIAKPTVGQRMKTAIEDGRAAVGQFFSYQFLEAGQTFMSQLEVDVGGRSQEILDEILATLTETTLRIGRSRHAEFGEIECKRCELMLAESFADSCEPSKELTLWLLSDLAVDDEFGTPTIAPRPECLGLPPGRLCVEKSFISSRRYAPYNGYLQRPELERCIIRQGSVLRYDLDEPFDPRALRCGVGLYRQAGLGLVWPNPPLIASSIPQLSETGHCARPLLKAPHEIHTDIPSHAVSYAVSLCDWLQAEGKNADLDRQSDRLLTKWLRELRELYTSARQLNLGGGNAPGKAQWGQVAGVCSERPVRLSQVRERLFDPNKGICRPGTASPVWDIEGISNGSRITFRDWLYGKLEQEDEREVRSSVQAASASADHASSRVILVGKLAERARGIVDRYA